jgi:hypothetical protein
MTEEVYKWRYGFRQTERLNFIKRVTRYELIYIEVSVYVTGS